MSDPWWRRRKKKSPWFNDIYEELEKLGDMIDETMEKAFENSSESMPVRRNRIKGFSIKTGPNGKPRIREFNVRKPLQDETEINDDPEPLIDIIEEVEMLVVLAALPGVDKTEIDLRVTEKYGGIGVNQTLFKKNGEADIVIAMFWPWQDGVHATLKIAAMPKQVNK